MRQAQSERVPHDTLVRNLVALCICKHDAIHFVQTKCRAFAPFTPHCSTIGTDNDATFPEHT